MSADYIDPQVIARGYQVLGLKACERVIFEFDDDGRTVAACALGMAWLLAERGIPRPDGFFDDAPIYAWGDKVLGGGDWLANDFGNGFDGHLVDGEPGFKDSAGAYENGRAVRAAVEAAGIEFV